ncbi:MAG: TIGR03084 family metal-binding protein [Gaiellales bacterium]
MADLRAIISDLTDEHESLEGIVSRLDAAGWDTPTPAVPWSVRDQISHLAFFDERARDSVSDRDIFEAHLQEVASDRALILETPLERGRAMDPDQVLDWWRSARASMKEVFARLDPKERVSWYGPPMSPASFISARLMETWAHGQDVVDALGISRRATDRLRHIAHLGVRARTFSYTANGMAPPTSEVQVVLRSPTGEKWSWGPDDATDRVEGSALGFCLVVGQRRHPDDTDVEAHGPAAEEWMSIAQCFAGPPGEGRAPGSFEWEAV